MKLHFIKNANGDINAEIEVGTVPIAFDYVEMLKQLSLKNEIEADFGNLEEVEKTKLNELLNKIRDAVQSGMEKPLE